VASDINTVLAGSNLVCERYFFPLKYKSPVAVASLGGNDARFTIFGGSLSPLDIQVGDAVDVLSGADSGTTWIVSAVDPAGQYVDATGSAPATPAGLPGVDIEIGPAARALRLRDTVPSLSVTERRLIRLENSGKSSFTAGILGWFPGMEARSRPVAAKDVASNIATSTSLLTAEAVFSPGIVTLRNTTRSSVTDAGRVVLSKYSAEGTIEGGVIVTFTTDAVENVEAGDRFVIRSSATPADVNSEGAVSSFTDTTITVVFALPISAGSVGIEVGPNVAFFFGDVLNITDGPNQGRYVVRENQGVGTDCSFEVLLEAGLPVYKDGNTPVTFSCEFGSERVLFKSRLKQVSSEIAVTGPGAMYFFVATPAGDIGTTPWLRFATFPLGVQVGDIVQLYEDQYNVVSRTFTVTAVEQGTSLIKVTPELESILSLPFDFNVPDPFGRIRVAKVADYASFKDRLNAWLAAAPQQDAYFRDLARFLNPILTNQNPTAAQVNDATNQLKRLLSMLTIAGAEAYGDVFVPPLEPEATLEYALNEYKAPTEESVATLLSTFRQKGADRAIDLLTSGQFSSFFGLSMDGVSYSGTLVDALRGLGREDLPVRKTNRRDAGGQKLIGSIPEDKDFEFSTDDADSPDLPDAPTGADVSTPGENF
jgi:hypothetical protein